MGFLDRFKKNRPDYESLELIDRIGGYRFSYVATVNESGEESIIGRSGAINRTFGDVVIVCDGSEVFRCTEDTVRAGELLSRDGARISGTDDRGVYHSVIAHYAKME